MSKQDTTQEVRWVRRFNTYGRALNSLAKGVELASERELSKLEKQGVIKSFGYTYELAWKTIKAFFKSVGNTDIMCSTDAFRVAFESGLVPDGALTKTIKDRNDTVHVYIQEKANEIFHAIIEEHYAAFEQLRDALQEEKNRRF